jgi:hypothetical protein
VDNITIEIVNGVVKITTGRISGPNHLNADALLKTVALDLGGETTVKSRTGHTHTHADGTVHDHDHAKH